VGPSAPLRRHAFALGLAAVTALVLWNPGGLPQALGLWLKAHRAPDAVIAAIFLLSGLRLSVRSALAGAADLPVVALGFAGIFVVSPLLALGFSALPLAPGLVVGLFLVASMPTTLTTGVVMTAAAGGNEATALVITLGANALAVAAVPVVLPWLLGTAQAVPPDLFDRGAMAARIAGLVLAPLALGMAIRSRAPGGFRRAGPGLRRVSLGLVLTIVGIAVAGSRSTLLGHAGDLAVAVGLSAAFHAAVLACLFGLVFLGRIGPGRREAAIFMGGQKTLPLAVLLQTSLFPGVGQALVVCVVHHLVHLLMDGYLVGRLSGRGRAA